jgi:catechol 2,3-dioxygenase-like lactoylglutathione lyase family enzyme
MTIRGLAHVNIRAAEGLIEQVRRFYVDVVGLSEGARPPFRSRGYWLYAGGLDIMHLTIDPSMTAASPASTGWLDHFAFAADDLDGTLARLEAANVPYQVDRVPSSNQAQMFFRDPAGVAIELNFTT